jgi:hypothetical protein
MRGIELGSLRDLSQEPLPEFSSVILPIPVESWRNRRVVPIRLRRLLLLELGLGPDVRAKKSFRFVNVGLSFLVFRLLRRQCLPLSPSGRHVSIPNLVPYPLGLLD